MLSISHMATGIAVVLLTFSLVPAVRILMIRRGVIDNPNARSSHLVATPRGGGIACVIALLAGALVAQTMHLPVPWILLGSAIVLAAIGAIDDRNNLPVAPRIAAQLIVGGVVGGALGGPTWIPVGAFITTVAVNVVNFMDGVNGITGGTMAVWGLVAAGVGANSNMAAVATIGVMTASTAIGFLPWNSPRAFIFLGDSGSYLFGGLVAATIIVCATSDADSWAPTWTVISPLIIYAFDVFYTIVRRVARGENPAKAHREHIYQKLAQAFRHHFPVAVCAVMFAIATAVSASAIEGIAAATVMLVLCCLYAISPDAIRAIYGKWWQIKSQTKRP